MAKTAEGTGLSLEVRGDEELRFLKEAFKGKEG